jgi:ATP-dependent DNA helicase PIF1
MYRAENLRFGQAKPVARPGIPIPTPLPSPPSPLSPLSPLSPDSPLSPESPLRDVKTAGGRDLDELQNKTEEVIAIGLDVDSPKETGDVDSSKETEPQKVPSPSSAPLSPPSSPQSPAPVFSPLAGDEALSGNGSRSADRELHRVLEESAAAELTHQQSLASLGNDQKRAFARAVDQYENLFITGKAGSGKSHLLKTIIHGLRAKGRTVAVLAPTGVAAYSIGGVTIHSFLTVPPAWFATRQLSNVLGALSKKPERLLRFSAIDVIVLDEVSMVCYKTLAWLDAILRLANDNTTVVFGAKQVLAVGDFYQLPPVGEKAKRSDLDPLHLKDKWMDPETADTQSKRPNDAMLTPFCFESPPWKAAFPASNCIELREIFRQKDPVFIELLNRARTGELNASDIELLRGAYEATTARVRMEAEEMKRSAALSSSLSAQETLPDVLFRPRLLAMRADVAAWNRKCESNLKLHKAPWKIYTRVKTLAPWEDTRVRRVDQQREWFRAHRSTMSRREQLFHAEQLAEFKVDVGEAEKQLLSEIPVGERLTLHLGSRVMLVKNWETARGLNHGTAGWVVGFGSVGPLVRFEGQTDDIEVPQLIWSANTKDGRLSFAQIPLTFAWAVTIHKCQGLSMPVADMNLEKLFAAGQCYVALSRVTTLDGLGLLNFRPNVCFADRRVRQFYNACFPPPDVANGFAPKPSYLILDRMKGQAPEPRSTLYDFPDLPADGFNALAVKSQPMQLIALPPSMPTPTLTIRVDDGKRVKPITVRPVKEMEPLQTPTSDFSLSKPTATIRQKGPVREQKISSVEEIENDDASSDASFATEAEKAAAEELFQNQFTRDWLIISLAKAERRGPLNEQQKKLSRLVAPELAKLRIISEAKRAEEEAKRPAPVVLLPLPASMISAKPAPVDINDPRWWRSTITADLEAARLRRQKETELRRAETKTGEGEAETKAIKGPATKRKRPR